MSKLDSIWKPPRRWLPLVVGLVLVAAAGWDLGRDPAHQMTARGLVAGIHLYRATLSPLLGNSGVRCRFEPTCSHYGEAVIVRFGAARGTMLAARRILRCGPWTPRGTLDPPPELPS